MKLKFAVILALSMCALTALAVANRAQQPTAPSSRPVYYDTFNEQWLNPYKWMPFGPGCARAFTMECVREIQNGRLRLAVRNIGATDSDSGSQFGESDLYFVNPNTINSITAYVTLSRFSAVACPANTGQPSWTVVKIQGNFFNTGSGDPADDISDEVDISVLPSDPKTMIVGNWFTGGGLGIGTEIGNYPIGTPLRLSNTWDKANHQFISVAQVIGESGPSKKVVVPYTVSDTTLPAYAEKQLTAFVYSQNCTSVQTFAQVETFFDNVLINVPPPSADQ
jgi:hypothetical protein